jgi:hypothetical protein
MNTIDIRDNGSGRIKLEASNIQQGHQIQELLSRQLPMIFGKIREKPVRKE